MKYFIFIFNYLVFLSCHDSFHFGGAFYFQGKKIDIESGFWCTAFNHNEKIQQAMKLQHRKASLDSPAETE